MPKQISLHKHNNILYYIVQEFRNLLNFIYPEYIDEELMKECNKNVINIKSNTTKFFETHIYLFKYEGIVRKKIIEYKFNDKSYLNDTFVKIMLKNEKICRFLKSYDIIMPVPIHKKRKKERGYNQSEIIAKKIAQNVPNLEFINDCLIKKVNTVAQSSLNKWQRIANVKNVYIINNTQKIKNKKVIIFDDIYTTGNTVNECAKILKQANANKILVLTIAKD